MNLPPLPTPRLENCDYTATDLQTYALLAIKEYKTSVSKRQSHRLFTDDQVCEIRELYAQHYPYKQVNKTYPMSEVTFINIIKRRGAYK